jgi:energy-coupling factor transporter ATP-binding protein EcfA2
MPVKIYYQAPQHSLKPQLPVTLSPPYFLLTRDKWNDLGISTTFDLFYCEARRLDHIGTLGIATGKSLTTWETIPVSQPVYADTYNFEIPAPFISLGNSISYYSALKEKVPIVSELDELLESLHDVIFLEHRHPDSPELELRKNEAFQKSVLKSTAALEAYGGGKQVLFGSELLSNRFDFAVPLLLNGQNEPFIQNFTFDSKSGLPANIFVLIGRNGLGKTQLLYAVQRFLTVSPHTGAMLFPRLRDDSTIYPSFRKVVAISFSPFEHFPIESNQQNGLAKYVYCGFRGEGDRFDVEKAMHALGKSLQDIIEKEVADIQLVGRRPRPRLQSLVRALKEGIGTKRLMLMPTDATENSRELVDLGKRLIEEPTELLEELRATPITFDRIYLDEKPVGQHSAGQQMFALNAINIVAHIEPDTLLLIDEPELYLHPNLECAFVRMLRTILNLFEAHAIVATHSVFVARETPASSISILRQRDDGVIVSTSPQLETFGGDLGTIANYIFDNVLEQRPYEDWLDGLLQKGVSLAELRKKFGEILNLESFIYLRGKIARKGEDDGEADPNRI